MPRWRNWHTRTVEGRIPKGLRVQIPPWAFITVNKVQFMSELKKYFGGYTNTILLGLTLGLFAFAFWYGVSGWRVVRDFPEKRQMNFSGEGKIAVKPDIAVFQTSVITTAKKVKDAQNENSERSNAVLAFLKGEGVAEKDLKTLNYNITPQYQYFDTPPCQAIPCPLRRPPEVVSYEVRHTIEIKVRDFSKTDDLLDGVIARGANEVTSVNFDIDDKDKVRADARKYAIDNAKEKATTLAKDLGINLGRIVAFSESGSEPPIYFARALEAKGGFGGDAALAPEVAPGEEELVVRVTITYEFR